jgi:hypothetical protein
MTADNARVIAGGGGSGNDGPWWCHAGRGGGSSGGKNGGSQTGGGGGSYSGSQFQGADGGYHESWRLGGGAGGGGWYGGGGYNNYGHSSCGGGGSGYIHPDYVDDGTTSGGGNSYQYVPPNIEDPFYEYGIGYGGTSSGYWGDEQPGRPGLVILEPLGPFNEVALQPLGLQTGTREVHHFDSGRPNCVNTWQSYLPSGSSRTKNYNGDVHVNRISIFNVESGGFYCGLRLQGYNASTLLWEDVTVINFNTNNQYMNRTSAGFDPERTAKIGGSCSTNNEGWFDYDVSAETEGYFYPQWRLYADYSLPYWPRCPFATTYDFVSVIDPNHFVCKPTKYLRMRSDYEMCGHKAIRFGESVEDCKALCDDEETLNCTGFAFEDGRCHLYEDQTDCDGQMTYADWYRLEWHLVCEQQSRDFGGFCGPSRELTGTTSSDCEDHCNQETEFNCTAFSHIPQSSLCTLYAIPFECGNDFVVSVSSSDAETSGEAASASFTWDRELNDNTHFSVDLNDMDVSEVVVDFSRMPHFTDISDLSIVGSYVSASPSVTSTVTATVSPSQTPSPSISPSTVPPRTIQYAINQQRSSLVAVHWTGYEATPMYFSGDDVSGGLFVYHTEYAASEGQLWDGGVLTHSTGEHSGYVGLSVVPSDYPTTVYIGLTSVHDYVGNSQGYFGFYFQSGRTFSIRVDNTEVSGAYGGYNAGDVFEIRFFGTNELGFSHNGYLIHSTTIDPSMYPFIATVYGTSHALVRQVLWLHQDDVAPLQVDSPNQLVDWAGFDPVYADVDDDTVFRKIDESSTVVYAWGYTPISTTGSVKGVALKAGWNNGHVGFMILDSSVVESATPDFGMELSSSGGIAIYDYGINVGWRGAFNEGDSLVIRLRADLRWEYLREGSVLYTSPNPLNAHQASDLFMLKTSLAVANAYVEARWVDDALIAAPPTPAPGDFVEFVGIDARAMTYDADHGILSKLQSAAFTSSYATPIHNIVPVGVDATAVRGMSMRIAAKGGYRLIIGSRIVHSGSNSNWKEFGLELDTNWRIRIYEAGVVSVEYYGAFSEGDKVTVLVTDTLHVQYLVNDIAFYTSEFPVFTSSDLPIIVTPAISSSYGALFEMLWVDDQGMGTITPSVTSSVTPSPSISSSVTTSPSGSPSESPSVTPAVTGTPAAASTTPSPSISPSVSPTFDLLINDTCRDFYRQGFPTGAYNLSDGRSAYCDMDVMGGGWELVYSISQNVFAHTSGNNWYDTAWHVTDIKTDRWLGTAWDGVEPLLPSQLGATNVKERYVNQKEVRFEFENGDGKVHTGWCDTTDNVWDWTSVASGTYSCHRDGTFGSDNRLTLRRDNRLSDGSCCNDRWQYSVALGDDGSDYAYEATPNYLQYDGGYTSSIIYNFDVLNTGVANALETDVQMRIYLRPALATPAPTVSASPTTSASLTPSPSVSPVRGIVEGPVLDNTRTTVIDDPRLSCDLSGVCGAIQWTGFSFLDVEAYPGYLAKRWNAANDNCYQHAESHAHIISSSDTLKGFTFVVEQNQQMSYVGLGSVSDNAGGNSAYTNFKVGVRFSDGRILGYDSRQEVEYLGGYADGDHFLIRISDTLRGEIWRNGQLLYRTLTPVDFTYDLVATVSLCSRSHVLLDLTWVDGTYVPPTYTKPAAGDPIDYTGFYSSYVEENESLGSLRKRNGGGGGPSGYFPTSTYFLNYDDVAASYITGVEFRVADTATNVFGIRAGFDFVTEDSGITSNYDPRFSFYLLQSSNLMVHDEDVHYGCVGAYNPGDILAIRLQDYRFQFVLNDHVVYTSRVQFDQSTLRDMAFRIHLTTEESVIEWSRWITTPYAASPTKVPLEHVHLSGVYTYPWYATINTPDGSVVKDYPSNSWNVFVSSSLAIDSLNDQVLGISFRPVFTDKILRVGFLTESITNCPSDVYNDMTLGVDINYISSGKGELRSITDSKYSAGFMPGDEVQLRINNAVDASYLEFVVNGNVFFSTEITSVDLPLRPSFSLYHVGAAVSELRWISPSEYVTVNSVAADVPATWKFNPTLAIEAGSGSLQALSASRVQATSERTFNIDGFVRGISFRVPINTVTLSIGFAAHPYSSFTIRFGISLDTVGRIRAIENEFTTDPIGAFSLNDEFELRLNEAFEFEIVRNGFILYTTTVSVSNEDEYPMVLILDMTGAGAKVLDVRWIGSAHFEPERFITPLTAIEWSGRLSYETIVTDSATRSIERLSTGSGTYGLAVSQGRIESIGDEVRGISFKPVFSDKRIRVGFARAADDVGSTSSESGTTSSNIKWSMEVDDGTVRIFDRGASQGVLGSFTPGDEFQIRLNIEDKVEFMVDGVILYTTFDAVYVNDFPLVLDVALYDAFSKLSDVFFISAKEFTPERTISSLDTIVWTGADETKVLIEPSTGALERVATGTDYTAVAGSKGRVRSLSVLSVKGFRFNVRRNDRQLKIGYGLAGTLQFAVEFDGTGRMRVKDFLDTAVGQYIGAYQSDDEIMIGINSDQRMQVMREGHIVFVSSRVIRLRDLPIEAIAMFYNEEAAIDNPTWLKPTDYPQAVYVSGGDYIQWTGIVGTDLVTVDPRFGVVQKTSGGTTWDACLASEGRIFSMQDTVRGLEFTASQNNLQMMIGFARVANDVGTTVNGYVRLEYAADMRTDGWIKVRNEGVEDTAAGFVSSYSPGDQVQIRLNADGQFEVVNQGIVAYTSGVVSDDDMPMSVLVCLKDPGVRIEQAAWITAEEFAVPPPILDGQGIFWIPLGTNVAVDVERGTVGKISATTAWDAHAVSRFVIASPDVTARGLTFNLAFEKALKIGLVSVASQTEPPYALHFHTPASVGIAGQLRVIDAGVDAGVSTTYEIAETFQISIDIEGHVVFLRSADGSVIYRSTQPIPDSDYPLLAKATFYEPVAKVADAQWVAIADCGASTVPGASLLNCDSTLSGSSCLIRCDPGFKGGFVPYMCSETGVWEPTQRPHSTSPWPRSLMPNGWPLLIAAQARSQAPHC